MDEWVRRLWTVVAVVAATVGSGCAVVTSEPGPTPSATSTSVAGPLVRIGVGPEQESALLGAVLAALAEEGGFSTRVVAFADSAAVRQALEVGDVDLAPGYTGQTWLEELGRENPPGDPRTSFQGVSAADESNGITWLRPAFDLAAGVGGPPADATLALWVTPDVAVEAPSIAELGSALAARPDAEVCLDPEFAERADGWAAVSQRYSIAARILVEATPSEAIAGVAAGQCTVGLSTLTDGQAWAAGLVPLADPLEVFPAFVVSVQLNDRALEANPGLEDALRPLADDLTTALLGTWNARVQAGEDLDQVAQVAFDQLAGAVDEGG